LNVPFLDFPCRTSTNPLERAAMLLGEELAAVVDSAPVPFVVAVVVGPSI
jgi:hypothetical protein